MTEHGYTESDHPGLHYQAMLADRVRMQRYADAINQLVQPGQVVADLGTGLGVLAMLAARAGAARVHAVEIRPQVAALAQRIIAANGLAERINVIQADARTLVLDEPVDLILNELIGDFGTDEGIVECVGAVASHGLRPGGRLLPARLITYLVPVEYGDSLRGVFRRDFHGMDLTPALALPFQPAPVLASLPGAQRDLGPAQVVERIRFAQDMAPRRHRFELQLPIERPGTLHGLLGWFDAELADGIRIASYPAYPGCHWQTWNWPVHPPRRVAPGQRLAVVLHAREGVAAAGWSLEWSLA